jgi:hypothetical protein
MKQTATGITTAATAVSSTFANYVLAEIRCAALRARLMANELNTMGVALKGGLIDTNAALAHLHEVGVLHLITGASS